VTATVAALRIAVVGCGRMGAERAARAAASGGAIVACVDADPARARALAASHGDAAAVADSDALPWSELDAVFICTPPAVRQSAVSRAIEARVAVMVEKPIGLSSADGATLTRAAKAAGVINAVGYMNRYRESVRHAKDLLVGKTIAAITCHWACRPYGVPWWSEGDKSGGPFNEQATHLVDLCRFVAGEIADVEAFAVDGSGANGPATRVAAALRFASGALGTLCYTCDAPDKFIALEAVTTAGGLRLDGWDFALTSNSIDGTSCGPEPNIFETETQTFLRAVARKDQSLIASSFEDATRTQEVVDAILAAAAR
jgi:myo-inositol 2-dehydrogenase/D-chiro-inositol 1-dehydrogenase